MKYILAVDLALSNLGWCLVEPRSFPDLQDACIPVEWGTVKTEKTKNKMAKISNDKVDRGKKLGSFLYQMLRREDVLGAVVELPPGGTQSSAAASGLGIATGVMAMCELLTEKPVEYYDPKDVKLTATGKKNASKNEMMDRCAEAYPGVQWPRHASGKNKGKFLVGEFEHIADAVFTAWTARNNFLFRMAINA